MRVMEPGSVAASAATRGDGDGDGLIAVAEPLVESSGRSLAVWDVGRWMRNLAIGLGLLALGVANVVSLAYARANAGE